MIRPPASPLRLHLGGVQPKPGWSIVNVLPGPHVDYLGSCADLSAFPDGGVEEVYASHVLEHLSHRDELLPALREIARVLRPGGVLRLSVPDLDILIRLFQRPDLTVNHRLIIMRYIFGAQETPYDYHKSGLTFDIMIEYLRAAGFTTVRRVGEFGLFDDTSSFRFDGEPISLNLEATR